MSTWPFGKYLECLAAREILDRTLMDFSGHMIRALAGLTWHDTSWIGRFSTQCVHNVCCSLQKHVCTQSAELILCLHLLKFTLCFPILFSFNFQFSSVHLSTLQNTALYCCCSSWASNGASSTDGYPSRRPNKESCAVPWSYINGVLFFTRGHKGRQSISI